MSCYSRRIGPNLKILHFNIEGISKDKSAIVAELAKLNGIDVIALQETHLKDDKDLKTRGIIPGFDVIESLYSNVHGISTYVKTDISNVTLKMSYSTNVYSIITIEIDNILISNVYKPPNLIWSSPPLPIFDKPTIYVGDFNSHSDIWGYDDNDINGDTLNDWINANNFSLIYSHQDKKTFLSARWKKEYNPDLCIVTDYFNNVNDKIKRIVMDNFPHSQHRPVLIEFGLQIPIFRSIPKP